MLKTFSLLRHPLRYPEWGEFLLAGMGLLQFIFAITTYQELTERPSLTLTLFFSPEGWAVAGIILFVGHIVGLRFGNTSKGYTTRLMAVSSSLVFWNHFILSILLNFLFFEGPVPSSLVPALGTPLLAVAVLYRLWRKY